MTGAPQNQISPDPITTSPSEQDVNPLSVIRTETVLSRLPVHNLAKKGRVDIQIVRTGATGEVELRWEVSYSERYGQARQLAYKLDTIVVDQKIDEAGKPLPDRIRIGSLHEICRDLGLTEGENKNSVKRAFFQNASAFITAKLKYKGNDGIERTFEAGFTRYSVIFTGQKFSNGTKADAVYIELHPRYREVINNAPMRPLNLAYKKQLAPAPQRFYEVVSYKIFSALKFNQPFARLPYSEYCTFSAQQRYFDYDHFKKQMYKIHRPHLQSGYIVKVHYQEATDEEGNRDWVMCYTPGPKARAEYDTFTGKRTRAVDSAQLSAHLPPADESITPGQRHFRRRPRQASLPLQPEINNPQLVAMTSRGVSEIQARKILADLPSDFPALDTLEWGDQQIAVQGNKIKNPPGFYISLLRDRLTPPSTFETSGQKTARLEAIKAQERRRQEEQEARFRAEQEERARGEARLQQLTREQYEDLHARVQAKLVAQYPFMANHPDSSLFEGSIRAGMVRYLSQSMELMVVPQPEDEINN